jgi:hypothetical protein
MSGHLLDEENWMAERPEIMQNAKAAVVCEHFGALEWKDVLNDDGKLEYKATGQLEPMWTMTYVFLCLFSHCHNFYDDIQQ